MGRISITDDLARELADLAEVQGVTVDEQAEALLRQALRRSKSLRDSKAKFAEIAGMSPAGVVQTDSVQLLREVRDR